MALVWPSSTAASRRYVSLQDQRTGAKGEGCSLTFQLSSTLRNLTVPTTSPSSVLFTTKRTASRSSASHSASVGSPIVGRRCDGGLTGRPRASVQRKEAARGRSCDRGTSRTHGKVCICSGARKYPFSATKTGERGGVRVESCRDGESRRDAPSSLIC